MERGLLERSNAAILTRLDADNLEDFWTAFEGVSHFTYYAWNAQREKRVTLLEMELQAEVDKYVATTLLLLTPRAAQPRGLHHWLFETHATRRAARRRRARSLSARESLRESIAVELAPSIASAAPVTPK